MADIATLGLKIDSKGVVVANKELKKLEKQGGKAEKQTKNITKSFKGLKTAAISLGGALAALGLVQLVRNAAKATVALDAIESSLKVATGSVDGAADSIKFLREEAERLGLDLQTSASAFSSLAAAARGTALEGQAARDVFIGVSEAMTALGRGSLDTERALRAIEQMISKGTVSAEELRGQLGEVLPGAFQLAAKSVGVTTQELGKMLQKGEVLASDLLPRMAQALRDTYSEEAESRARGLQAEMNRFNTAVFDLMNSGNMDGLADAIRDFTGLLKDEEFQKSFGAFVTGLVKIGEYGARAAASIAAQTETTIKWWEAEEKGAISFWEWMTTGNEAAAIRLKQLDMMSGKIKRINEDTKGTAVDTGPQRPKETGENLPTLTFPSAELLPDATALEAMERYNSLLMEAETIAQQVKTPAQNYADQIELLNRLRETSNRTTGEMLIDQETYARAVKQAQDELKDGAEEVDETWKELGLTFQSAFEDAIVEGKSLSDVLKSLEKDLVRLATRKLITEPLMEMASGFLGGIGGGGGDAFGGGTLKLPEFANGTNFAPGGLSIVGEKGPELVNLPRGASVTPNDKIGDTNISVQITMSGSGGADNAMGYSPRQVREAARQGVLDAQRSMGRA